jgi:hypothetical protein
MRAQFFPAARWRRRGTVTLITNTIGPSVYSTTETTPVTVRSFTGTLSARGALLRWRTASETEAVGYNVYGHVHGRRVKLNRRLVAAKRAADAAYTFRYRARAGNKPAACFWLQIVNLDGSRHWYGAATVPRIGS